LRLLSGKFLVENNPWSVRPYRQSHELCDVDSLKLLLLFWSEFLIVVHVVIFQLICIITIEFWWLRFVPADWVKFAGSYVAWF
jgi:hypothetical protein